MKINSYNLSLGGLTLNYTNDQETHNIEYAPFPTCELFRELNIIESYESDENQEPILITAEGNRHEWHTFVKLFKLDTTLPLEIAKHHDKQNKEPYSFFVPLEFK